MIPTKSSQHTTTNHTNKRRIASFEHESQSSPTRAPSAPAFNAHPPPSLNLNSLKRQRISRSPSRPRDTPRYSTGPPSPFAFFDDVNAKREEGMTPFAYATPYSNAPYVERARTRSRTRSSIGIYEDEDGDGDYVGNIGKDGYGDDEGEGSTTDDLNANDRDGEDVEGGEANALSDFESDSAGEGDEEDLGQARQVDEEWEGVQDDLDLEYTHTSTSHYDPRLLPAARSNGKAIPSAPRSGPAEHNMENFDDQASDVSSVPSEYPSRQPEGLFDLGMAAGPRKAGFKIHVDEEVE